MSHEMERRRRIEELLRDLNIYSEYRLYALLGLTDGETLNPHPALARRGLPMSAGAGTARLFRWVADRLGSRHIDREQRDYVFPQLIDMGLVDKALILSEAQVLREGRYVAGGVHKPKSSNNVYVATEALLALLDAAGEDWPGVKARFLRGHEKRRRKTLERESAKSAHQSRSQPNEHAALIRSAVEALLRTVAVGYEVIFIDDSDGSRIQEAYRTRLETLGLVPDLGSKWPDAMLLKPDDRSLWFVEAVTSDGEVDDPRGEALTRWAEERGFQVSGLTTAYETWRRAAVRQARHRNLAIGSTLWIAEDGGKLFKAIPLIPDDI